MASIKILVCDGSINYEYIDIRIQKICNYLQQQKHHVEVIALYRNRCSKDNVETYIYGIKCNFIGCRGKATNILAETLLKKNVKFLYPIWFLVYLFKIRKLFLSKEPFYVIGENIYGALGALFYKRKAKKIIFDMREFFGLQATGKIRSKFETLLLNILLKNSHMILYVNLLQISSLPSSITQKCLFLPNYPDSTIKPLQKHTSDIIRIAYIGSIRKNQKAYFEKFSKACSEVGTFIFLVHGGGDGYADIKYLEKKYKGIVYVTGQYDGRAETSRLFSECDILYCAYDINIKNWKMAEPIKFFEAIATRTPVIISKGAFIEEIVNRNKVGFSIDAENITEIKDLLKYLLANRQIISDFGENSANISEMYRWENVVKILDNLFL